MLVRGSIEMRGNETEARECVFSIDARASVRDRFELLCTDGQKVRNVNAEAWPRLARFCFQARATDDVEVGD